MLNKNKITEKRKENTENTKSEPGSVLGCGQTDHLPPESLDQPLPALLADALAAEEGVRHVTAPRVGQQLAQLGGGQGQQGPHHLMD